jgi:hypothetical protein
MLLKKWRNPVDASVVARSHTLQSPVDLQRNTTPPFPAVSLTS